MKARFILLIMLVFAALEGHAATVLPSDGGSWPGKGLAIGKNKHSDVISLGADTSGASAVDKILSPAGNLAIVLGLNYGQAKKLQDSISKIRWGDVKGKGKKLGHSDSDESTPTPGGVSSVPLPAAVWLFASALLGLTVVARRKMQTTAA